ncbi:hypothetical protein SLEP1_g51082 [Rubroshorea leprosula]|uniref:Uncharacterized protein n=1 Tax=Rubroshorea leprosula TaxID=152421 RepID=A0AAV5M2U6_9ROSI|nr:hypothetical protein SLEP1_g51082 [Rubroshorea leprosula]
MVHIFDVLDVVGFFHGNHGKDSSLVKTIAMGYQV